MNKQITPQELIENTRCIEYHKRETLIEYLDLIKPNQIWVKDLDGSLYLMKSAVTDNKGEIIALEVKKPYTCKITSIQPQHASLIW